MDLNVNKEPLSILRFVLQAYNNSLLELISRKILFLIYNTYIRVYEYNNIFSLNETFIEIANFSL